MDAVRRMASALPTDVPPNFMTIMAAEHYRVGPARARYNGRVRLTPALFVSLAVGLAACVIRDVDFDAKRCPCDEGFWCDDARDRCVPGEPPDGGPGGGDAPGIDAGPRPDAPGVDAGETPGVFGVENLRAEWATPNTIRWAWDPTGAETDLAYYEIVVSESEDLSGASVWDVDDNPELGRYRLPRTGLGDVVTGTITDGLTEDTFYYAQLVAVDTAGGRVRSNVAVGHTEVAPRPMGFVVMFDDARRGGGYALPGCIDVVGTGEHAAGTAHLEWLVRCEDGLSAECAAGTGGECWENLRQQDMTIDLSGLSVGDFSTAFLEFALSYTGEQPAWYSEASVMVGTTRFTFVPLTHRADGRYRRFQIPLDQMSHMGTPMTHADLATLTSWRFGAQWTHDGVVRVDEIRIRW